MKIKYQYMSYFMLNFFSFLFSFKYLVSMRDLTKRNKITPAMNLLGRNTADDGETLGGHRCD
jgi:hypothetical protein